MFTSEGRIFFKWKLSVFLHRQMWKLKTLIGRGAGTSQHLPQEVRWKPRLRGAKNASHAAPAAAFGSIHLPGGVRQKKRPTVAPQMAPFTLVSSVFIHRTETWSKQTRSRGWCLTQGRRSRGGVPSSAASHVRTWHMQKCRPHYQTAQEGNTWEPCWDETNVFGAAEKEINASGTDRGPVAFHHFQRRISQ